MSLHDFVKTQFIYAKPGYSIRNLVDIKRIIYLDSDKGTVFQAAQARMYNFTKNSAGAISIYDWLASELHSYLNNGVIENMRSFDDWHHKICNDFVTRSNALGFKNIVRGGRVFPVAYGMAQKFLNIALKYIYCFDDSNSVDKFNKFTFCHIALDSFTYCPKVSSRHSASYTNILRPITRISGVRWRKPFYVEVVNIIVLVNNLDAWSKLNYHRVGTTIGYMDIQSDLRNFFSTNPVTYSNVAHLDTLGLASCPLTTPLSPFEIEFFLW